MPGLRRAPRRPRRAQARILVVDDDPQTLRHVRDVLTAEGYATAVTGDHRELSHVIQAEKPHLVLLDLMLSGTDGIELMEHVPELADLPVIFISAYGRDETIARALGAGAADYIVKPFFSHGAYGESPGRPEKACRTRTLRARTTRDRLRTPPGDPWPGARWN